MFCPKCGSLLKIGKEGAYCSCGYTEKGKKEQITEHSVNKEKSFEYGDESFEILPLTDAKCPKCKHNKAYYWTVQTRAGDEPETKFLKCEKCRHVWRDYK